MTATGAEAGSGLAPVGPGVSADIRGVESVPARMFRAGDIPGVTPVRRRVFRAGFALVLAVSCVATAWLLLRHGVRTDDFPPFIDSESSTPITRYSGPWRTAAAAMALVAALFLLFATVDLVRRPRRNREGR